MGANSTRNMNTPYIIKATTKQTASVIFLHGLGDSGAGWCDAFKLIIDPRKNGHIKFIFPNASPKPVSLNGGMTMPSWFDIKDLSPNGKEDETGIIKSKDLLKSFVETEVKSGILQNRIIIGGFSQGGATALYTAFGCPAASQEQQFAAVMALSSWMPLHKSLMTSGILNNLNTPLLQCHGTSDPVVQFPFGELTSKLIANKNKNSVFKSYKGVGHSSSEEEMKDLKSFMNKHLPVI